VRGVLKKVLIANRGAIACRIIRTLRRLHVSSVAVFSEADSGSLHVAQADEAVCIGAAPASKSYLNAMAVIDAAKECGAQAIHPGYGFLSENAQFAAQCEASGLIFIGPTAQNMRSFGLKHTARDIARTQSVPLVPGSALLVDLDEAREAARRIGFPVMLKATGGGGGIGMRVCADLTALEAAFPTVSRLAASNFADAGVYLERFLPEARHVEVQVFGNGSGRVVALGERDCSLQRRHQKIIEEAPAPALGSELRTALAESAIRLTSAVEYRSAGTVEFLLDPLHGGDTDAQTFGPLQYAFHQRLRTGVELLGRRGLYRQPPFEGLGAGQRVAGDTLSRQRGIQRQKKKWSGIRLAMPLAHRLRRSGIADEHRVDRGAEEPLDEKGRSLISGYEIAQRPEDGAVTEAIASLEKARCGRRQTDALAFEAFERVHLPLERDKGFVGAKELSSRRGLALAHLAIVGARGVEIRGRHAKAGDGIDGSQGGFVALAPNE